MKTVDLALRCAIIYAALQLACAWAQTFQSPWPLVDAFELAPTANEQLFRSLGIRFSALLPILAHPADSMKARSTACSTTTAAAKATYTLSAPFRLTPWTSPWSYRKSFAQ